MEGILNKALTQFASISVMQFVCMTVITIAIYTVIIAVRARIYDREISIADVVAVYSYIVYVNIILQLTLMGRQDGSRIGVEINPFQFLQSGGAGYNNSLAITYSILNIMLFVPYGFIVAWLPFFKKQKRKIKFCLSALICLATSLFIEIMQLGLGRGYYELEDLICNTLGGVIGTAFFCIVYEYIFQEEYYRD